jgi:hypothetical protein
VNAVLGMLGKLLKRRILSRPFEPGFNLNAEAQKVAWNEAATFDDGVGILRSQIVRAGAAGAAPSAPHPFFGPLTPAQWHVYYLRHAELHLSFLQP